MAATLIWWQNRFQAVKILLKQLPKQFTDGWPKQPYASSSQGKWQVEEKSKEAVAAAAGAWKKAPNL